MSNGYFDESIHELFEAEAVSETPDAQTGDETPEGDDSTADITPNEGTVPWLKLELAKLEIEIPADANKADLEKLLADAQSEPEE